MIFNVEIKKNEKKNEYQIWVNGGVNSTFDAEIFHRQQILNLAEKMFEPETKKGNIVHIENKIVDEPIYVCSRCGSEDVETKVWFNELTGDMNMEDEPDTWCNDCEEHYTLDQIQIVNQ
jgi:uncharacterized glyoxalase superfamily protein PhnB